jgi:transposase
LVPRQHSTGGKIRLHDISKRGDRYLRTLLIHGARLVLRFAARHTNPTPTWLKAIQARRNANLAAMALANKHARIVWAHLAHDRDYNPDSAGTSP